jgi:hypothetical protein
MVRVSPKLVTLQTSKLVLNTTKTIVALFSFTEVLTPAQDTKLIELFESKMAVISEHGPPGVKEMAKFILDHAYRGLKCRFILHLVEIALQQRAKRTYPACEAKGFTNLKDGIDAATAIAKQAVERFLPYMSGLTKNASIYGLLTWKPGMHLTRSDKTFFYSTILSLYCMYPKKTISWMDSFPDQSVSEDDPYMKNTDFSEEAIQKSRDTTEEQVSLLTVY